MYLDSYTHVVAVGPSFTAKRSMFIP